MLSPFKLSLDKATSEAAASRDEQSDYRHAGSIKMSTMAEHHRGGYQYTLRPKPPLITGISDHSLSLLVPIITHWITAAVYEIVRRFDLFRDSRIHTSEEERSKNTISRLECLRGVILVQILQTGLGILLGAFSGVEMTGYEDRDIMIWTSRLHDSKRAILTLFPSYGLRMKPLNEHEIELLVAKFIYYGLIPALRFYVGLWLADTWVFFIHRAEHSNQWLYKNFHYRHHELYVPYSWGAIYDHPLESLFLSVGAFVVAVIGSGMTLRESMLFSAFSSVKACTDHGGYKFLLNPINVVTTVDAAYHDKHHQRWGLKTNFALHFRLWDRIFGTEFADADTAARLYARDRRAAEVARGTNGVRVKSA